jgi:hypothetical protein
MADLLVADPHTKPPEVVRKRFYFILSGDA